jgi:nitrate/nitrite-specific signal transduction histidine kinase
MRTVRIFQIGRCARLCVQIVEAAHAGHYGLAGLREQTQLIWAVLAIHSAPQQGTKISIMLAAGLDS